MLGPPTATTQQEHHEEKNSPRPLLGRSIPANIPSSARLRRKRHAPPSQRSPPLPPSLPGRSSVAEPGISLSADGQSRRPASKHARRQADIAPCAHASAPRQQAWARARRVPPRPPSAPPSASGDLPGHHADRPAATGLEEEEEEGRAGIDAATGCRVRHCVPTSVAKPCASPPVCLPAYPPACPLPREPLPCRGAPLALLPPVPATATIAGGWADRLLPARARIPPPPVGVSAHRARRGARPGCGGGAGVTPRPDALCAPCVGGAQITVHAHASRGVRRVPACAGVARRGWRRGPGAEGGSSVGGGGVAYSEAWAVGGAPPYGWGVLPRYQCPRTRARIGGSALSRSTAGASTSEADRMSAGRLSPTRSPLSRACAPPLPAAPAFPTAWRAVAGDAAPLTDSATRLPRCSPLRARRLAVR